METKTEYYKSIKEFKVFMNQKKNIHDISFECRNTCVMLKEILKSKRDNLGNHWRMKIKNCMDAMTTSPLESSNKALKYGLYLIHSTMNVDSTCRRVLNGANSRIQQRRNNAKKKCCLNYHSS